MTMLLLSLLLCIAGLVCVAKAASSTSWKMYIVYVYSGVGLLAYGATGLARVLSDLSILYSVT